MNKMTNTTKSADLGYDSSSIWMLTNGSAKAEASAIDVTLLAPYDGNAPPSARPDVTRVFTINQTGIVSWVMDGSAYSEPKIPIIYGNKSDAWNANTTLHLPLNSTIDIIMRIANDSMDTVSDGSESPSARSDRYGRCRDPDANVWGRGDRWGTQCIFTDTSSGSSAPAPAASRMRPSRMRPSR